MRKIFERKGGRIIGRNEEGGEALNIFERKITNVFR